MGRTIGTPKTGGRIKGSKDRKPRVIQQPLGRPPGRSPDMRGKTRSNVPSTITAELNHMLAENRKKLMEQFDPVTMFVGLLDDIKRLEVLVDQGMLPKRDHMDLMDLRLKAATLMMPFIAPKLATSVVHQINTDQPSADKAREAVLKTMQRLRDDSAPVIDMLPTVVPQDEPADADPVVDPHAFDVAD